MFLSWFEIWVMKDSFFVCYFVWLWFKVGGDWDVKNGVVWLEGWKINF